MNEWLQSDISHLCTSFGLFTVGMGMDCPNWLHILTRFMVSVYTICSAV